MVTKVLSKASYMVRLTVQSSLSLSPPTIQLYSTWTLPLRLPLPHYDLALQGLMSVCKTAGVWQKTYFFSKFYIFQIIRLSETWLSEGITDHEILLQAYTTYRKDRGTPGGGVFLAISSNLVIYADCN